MKGIITNNNLQSTIALAALQQVIDPEIGLNIVDLGLIFQIDFDEESKELFTTMTLTTQFCPMGDSIRNSTMTALQHVFPAYKIQINLTFDPPWNAERISEEGKEFLNNSPC